MLDRKFYLIERSPLIIMQAVIMANLKQRRLYFDRSGFKKNSMINKFDGNLYKNDDIIKDIKNLVETELSRPKW